MNPIWTQTKGGIKASVSKIYVNDRDAFQYEIVQTTLGMRKSLTKGEETSLELAKRACFRWLENT